MGWSQNYPRNVRIYAINVHVKEASRNFIYSVERLHYKDNKNQRKTIDLKWRMYSNQEWSSTSSKTSTFFIRKWENKKLCVFSKEPYLNIHTTKMVYSVMLDLLFSMMFHQKLILTAFEGSKCSVFPPIKYDAFTFDPDLPKYHYIQIVFKEVSIE